MAKKYLLTTDNIVDNLTSTDAEKSLSANQGRMLNTTKVGMDTSHSDQNFQIACQSGIVTVYGDDYDVPLANGCPFPVGGIYISVGNTNPSTIWTGTTWSKLNDGTILMADSTGGKTAVSPEVPKPTVSIGASGDHNHDRGTMDITGDFRICPSADSNVGDTTPIKSANGAFYNAGGAGGGSQRVYDINASYSRDYNPQAVGFQASRNWSGNTSTGGNHSHTATVSGAAYTDSGKVIPSGTIKVVMWERTA